MSLSIGSIGTWAQKAYTTFQSSDRGKGLASFLNDPFAKVTNYLTDRAFDYGKRTLLENMNRYNEDDPSQAQIQYTSAGKARTGTQKYGRFESGKINVPGMRNPAVSRAFKNLYNSPSLRVSNVDLTIQATRPNILPSKSTIGLGSSNVPRQKLAKKSVKTALKR